MRVIRCDLVVHHAQTEAIASLAEPAHPGAPIACELQQELLTVAPVGNVPNLAGEVLSVAARHGRFAIEAPFRTQNR